MTPIREEDKPIIKNLYFQKLYGIHHIQQYFNNRYEHAQIRSYVFRIIDEVGEQYGQTK